VAAADLQTSQLSINPTSTPNGRINGYDVTNLVTATLRDIGGAGGLVDAAAAAAGDAVRIPAGTTFTGDTARPASPAASTVPIEAGTQQLSVTVELTYALG
jgi:uncharacterized protein